MGEDTNSTIEQPSENPENTGATQGLRNEKGQFVPGVSGNPTGPKPGYRHMTTLLKQYLTSTHTELKDGTKVRLDDAIMRKLSVMAGNGNMKAIELLMGYIDGKPKETHKHEMEGNLDHFINPDRKSKLDELLDYADNDNQPQSQTSE